MIPTNSQYLSDFAAAAAQAVPGTPLLDRRLALRQQVVAIALAVGAINSHEPVEEALERAEEALGAEGVATADVEALDAWLASLTQEQRDVLADGEEDEIAAIEAESPMGESGYRVAALLYDVWEVL